MSVEVFEREEATTRKKVQEVEPEYWFLFVDDDQISIAPTLVLFKRFLEKVGLTKSKLAILEANDGATALRHLEQRNNGYAAESGRIIGIISDGAMPGGMNGSTLLDRAVNRHGIDPRNAWIFSTYTDLSVPDGVGRITGKGDIQAVKGQLQEIAQKMKAFIEEIEAQ